MRIKDAITPRGQRVAIIPMDAVLDATVTMEVRRQIQQVMDFGYNHLILNMSAVNSFDSSGMGVLVSTLKRCKLAKGNMVLCALPQLIQLSLEIASLDKVLTIFETEAEAIAKFPS